MPAQIDFECLIETLAEHEETFSRPDETSDSSILEIKAELQLLEASLRRSAPADPFDEESACDEALNLVEAIGRNPSFTTRQELAGDPLPSSNESTVLPLGGVLGQYRLLQKLGEGGFGTVYQALHLRLDKIVALKVLTANRLRDPHAVDRFDREMRAVGKLHHVNIVAAHDAGEIDGMHYLVMELVDGIDLRKLVKQHGRLPIGAACELIRQAAVGLQHVHEHGLVHRDIKPSNLMLTLPENHDDAPAVKLLDLGLALLDESHLEHVGELTATGQVMGTLEYMAPEQGADTHAVDIRADIYSLGATLYKLLTGKAPLSSDQYRSPVKLLMALATQDPPPLRDRCPQMPSELDAVIQKMLAKNPADRYSTPRELAEALAPFSCQADVQALVDFLATAADGELIDRHAPALIGTPQLSSPATGKTSPPAAIPRPTTQRRATGRWRATIIALAFVTSGLLMAAAIYVIQIQTPQGELVIQSDYAGITVKVTSDGKEVNNGWSLVKGQDNKQLILTGQVEIELPAELTGEYTVTPNRVTLTKDRQEIVRIEQKASPAKPVTEKLLPLNAHPAKLANVPKPNDPANSIDRDRAAAQHWIVNGGTCTIVLKASGKKLLISPNGRLPSAPFELRAASASSPGTTSQQLESFIGLTGLHHVSLERSTIDGRSIVSLSQIPNLRSIRFNTSQVWASELTGLSKLPFLHEIAIDDGQVDDEWEFLRHLPNLRNIEIANYAEPSMAEFLKWSEFPQLRLLRLDGQVTPEMAAKLHERNPLCRIVAWSPDKQIASPTGEMPQRRFQVVGIDPVRVGAKALLPLGFRCSTNDRWDTNSELALPYVRDLRNTDPFTITTLLVPRQRRVTEQAVSCLGKLNFDRLNAAGLDEADTFATQLPTTSAVEEIDLSRSDLTDDGLQQLQRVNPFPVLNVQGTHVTQAGIDSFRKARPACLVVSNFTPRTVATAAEVIPPAPIKPLVPADRERAAAELWQQRLGSGTLFNVAQPQHIPFDPYTKLPNQRFNMVGGSGEGLQELTNSDLEHFVNLNNLTGLYPWGDGIDSGAIPYLKQMPTLITLDLTKSRIPSSAVTELRDLPHLTNLKLPGDMIDDQWKFLHQLKSIYRLHVTKFQPTATDWKLLQEASRLRVIHFHDDIVVDVAALEEFQRRNPLCLLVVGWPKFQSVGVDPMRQAVRELAGRNIGFQLRVNPNVSQGSTIQEVLDNPSPFYVNRIAFQLTKDHKILDQTALEPLRAIAYDELAFRSEGVSADEFVAALPDDLKGQRIDLADTDLTDQGLLRLSRIARPIQLDIHNTRVTPEGIKAYRKALPHCQVLSNP